MASGRLRQSTSERERGECDFYLSRIFSFSTHNVRESTSTADFHVSAKPQICFCTEKRFFCGLFSHSSRCFQTRRCFSVACSKAGAVRWRPQRTHANKHGQVARGSGGAAVCSQQPERDKCGPESGWLISRCAPNTGLKCWPGPRVSAVHRFEQKSVQKFSSQTRRSVTLLRLICPSISQLFVSRTKGLEILPAFDPRIQCESPTAFGEVFLHSHATVTQAWS